MKNDIKLEERRPMFSDANMQGSNEKSTVFSRKWAIIVSISLLIFSNTVAWISFSPIGNYVNAVYGENSATFFSLIFMVITIPLGFVGMYVASANGLKFAAITAAILQFIGTCIRFISTFSSDGASARFWLCITGQSISALAYPLIMFLPSRVSADWFLENERTLATTIGVMSAPFGVMIVNLTAPMLVKSADDVWILNLVVLILSVIAGIWTWTSIIHSTPTNQKRASSNTASLSYTESFSKCARTNSYLIIALVLGGGIGMFNCLYTIMQGIMCPSGYNNQVAGICAVMMISCGVVGALVAGRIVDQKKCFTEMLIVLMVLAVSSGVIFLQLTRIVGLPVWVLYVASAAFGCTGLAAYPVGLELAVEVTFPASAEVVTGTVVLLGQAFSALFVLIFQKFAVPFNQLDLIALQNVQVCQLSRDDVSNVPQDYTQSIIIMSTIASTLVILVIILKLISPKYQRQQAQVEIKA